MSNRKTMKYNLRPKGQPIQTHAQLSENDRTATCANIQATFEAILKKIGQSSHNYKKNTKHRTEGK